MRITFDSEADAVYIQFADEMEPNGVARTYLCDPGEVGGIVDIDIDSDGRLLGMEILTASAMLPAELLEEAKSREFGS